MAELPTHLRGAPMGEEKVSRAVLAAHQRERVIAKATPVFAKRGYRPTTVDDLLASAKVGVGNFYSLFDGKEDCFLTCLDTVVEQVLERVETAVVGRTDWETRAYLGLGAMLGFFCAEPLASRLVLVEAQTAGAEPTHRYDALLDRSVAWLAEGRNTHSVAATLPPSFERASVAGLAFYLQQCLLEARRPSPDELLAETAGLLLEPVIGAARLDRLRRDLARDAVGPGA
ncbi:MAG TPA: TetR/AcrR family transcriptional regulator [Solirubrobacterales bacterium]|jgi:AcrR family transcriptional regulator|nr:TetR/AcrR family transcriptional regulator [Solirubrobacterales bacterium]